MSDRRMFAKTIIDSDAFLEMGVSSQLLYFHLGMRADDDGVVNNPKSIMRMVGCNNDDLRVLQAKKFVIILEDQILIIKHWKINNYIQKDRYKPSKYQDYLDQLSLDENNAYTENDNSVSIVDTQVSIGKNSIELNRKENNNNIVIKEKKSNFIKPSLEEIKAYVLENNKNIDYVKFFNYYETNGWKVGKNAMKNWHSAIALWERNNNENNVVVNNTTINTNQQEKKVSDDEWDIPI